MDRDAILEISISDDRMTVHGTFLPFQGEGRHLTPEYIESVLENAGVVHGLKGEAIAEAMFACNTDQRVQEQVVIAEGTPPQAARPAYWDVSVAVTHGATGSDPKALKVDYKQETHLQVVHSGDQLAVRIPRSEGIPGTDVFGQEIPFPTESVPTREPGAHTRVEENTAIAETGGKLVVTDTDFHVEEVLEITGDVGYGTGSIEFPGDVVLKGEVKEGFHIWAGKNVTADRTVDVSQIYCRGSFSANGGIIGRGKALLRAGESVTVRFIGNCYVESKGSVNVKQYAYHARIGCLGQFVAEKDSHVIGGVITAADGITCGILGNAAGIPTYVRSGIDFIVERKLRLNREKHQAITLRLQKLLAKLGQDPTDRQLEIVHQLEDIRNRYVENLGDLTCGLDRNEEARIVVTGTVYPGVQVQICRAEYVVTEAMNAVVFHLDKETGRIVASDIESKSPDS